MADFVFGHDSINSVILDYSLTFFFLLKIEGLPSFLLAICVFLFLPSRPDKSRYINEEERTLCVTRLNSESLAEHGLGIDWRGARRAFTDWKTYLVAVCLPHMPTIHFFLLQPTDRNRCRSFTAVWTWLWVHSTDFYLRLSRRLAIPMLKFVINISLQH